MVFKFYLFSVTDTCVFLQQPPLGMVCDPFVNGSINVTLTCQVHVAPARKAVEISWWREACGYKNKVASCTDTTCSLSITDEGVYTCCIKNETSNEFRISSDLDYSCLPSCSQKELVQIDCQSSVPQSACGSGSLVPMISSDNQLCSTASTLQPIGFTATSVSSIHLARTWSKASNTQFPICHQRLI